MLRFGSTFFSATVFNWHFLITSLFWQSSLYFNLDMLMGLFGGPWTCIHIITRPMLNLNSTIWPVNHVQGPQDIHSIDSFKLPMVSTIYLIIQKQQTKTKQNPCTHKNKNKPIQNNINLDFHVFACKFFTLLSWLQKSHQCSWKCQRLGDVYFSGCYDKPLLANKLILVGGSLAVPQVPFYYYSNSVMCIANWGNQMSMTIISTCIL